MNCEDCDTCPICIEEYLKKQKINYPKYYQYYISNLKKEGIDNKKISHDDAKNIYNKNKETKEFNDNKFDFDNRIKIRCYYIDCKSNCSNNKCKPQYHICRGCYIKYLRNELEPKCPNCTKIWSYEFITSFMTDKFMKTEWRQIIIEKYKRNEEKYMPLTQKMLEFINDIENQTGYIVENYIKIIEIRKKIYEFYKDYIDKCRCNMFKYYENIYIYKDIIKFDKCTCIDTSLKNILIISKHKHEIEYEELLLLIYKINIKHTEKKYKLQNKLENKEYLDENSNNIYIKNCQNNNCNGYLSDDWKCTLCNKETCNTCYECKENEEHICNPDTIKTNKLIHADSKPCPKCQTMISKISGCNQMYCVKCKAKYDWTTNNIITKHFHNPELQRELRNGGDVIRLNNDFICGGIPKKKELIINDYKNYIEKCKCIDLKNMVNISVIIIGVFWEFAYDYENVYYTRLNTDINNYYTHEKLRIKKLKNEITEKEWINKLCIREKSIEKNKFSNIYLRELYYSISDILRNCIKINDDVYNYKLLYENSKSLISLYDIYNDIFNNKIHKVYGGTYYNILFKKNNIPTSPYTIKLEKVNVSIKFINIFKKNMISEDLFYNKTSLTSDTPSIINKIIDDYTSFKF